MMDPAFLGITPLPLQSKSQPTPIQFCKRSRNQYVINNRTKSSVLKTVRMTVEDEKEETQEICDVCNGEQSVQCTNCNAFGFFKIDTEAVWKTCELCKGRGKLICTTCQPPDARLPDDFESKLIKK